MANSLTEISRVNLIPVSTITSLTNMDISVDIGQYHFITPEGWREEWVTITAGEWQKKQEWLKAGGWKQDGKEKDS